LVVLVVAVAVEETLLKDHLLNATAVAVAVEDLHMVEVVV
jgi:hypothetical protein